MTKRSNTGTGGIAYRDVLCNNSWGYAFSSDLNNTTNFNDYTFLQNTPIIQKFIEFYNFTSNMGIQIPLSNNILSFL